MGCVSAERSETSLSLGLKNERWRLLVGLLVTVAVICLTRLLFSASGVTALHFLMVYLFRLLSPVPFVYTNVSDIAAIGERMWTYGNTYTYTLIRTMSSILEKNVIIP